MKYLWLLIAIILLPAFITAQQSDMIGGVLIGDEPTSQTIIGAQSLAETELSEVRVTMNRTSSVLTMNANLDQLTEALAQFVEVTEVRLPEQRFLLRSLGARADTLLGNLRADYIDEDYQQAEVSFRILSQTWDEMKSIPAAANVTGLQTSSSLIPEPPSDWDTKGNQVGFGSAWTLRTGQEISAALRNKIISVQNSTEISLKQEHLENIQEIRRMSLLLRERTGELPAVSRKGFLDHALQLEVIADNLQDYYDKNNQLAFRRQLNLALNSIDGLREYYSVQTSNE